MTKHNPLIYGMALAFALTSCDDNEPEVPTGPVTTQFIQNQITISENETANEVSIILNQTTAKEGIITIAVSTEHFNSFTTTPAIIDGKIQLTVLPGQGEATFSFTPVDNNLLNESRSIHFTIESVSEGFVVGGKKLLTVVVIDNESPAFVGFQNELSSTLENSNSPSTVMIALSHASTGTGTIEVSLNSANATYGVHYLTEPAAVDNKIVLSVVPGVDRVEFKVLPLNDQLFNGDRNIQHTISKIEGAIMLGQAVTNTLKITDDELVGKAKGYTTGAGGWGYKKEYQYNEQGNVSKVLWEQHAPGNSLSATETYEYDANGNVVKMTESYPTVGSSATVTTYTWENGRIVKEESVRDGEVKKYILYGYDDAGNVGESAIHYRQPNGELKLSMLIVFLYHQDGNLYKQMNYSPIEGSDDYNLLSTKTWETYSTKENPFTMVEILPNQTTQSNLPLSYRLEEGGHNFLYQLTYQFNAAGKPTKRTATSSAGSETATYEYY